MTPIHIPVAVAVAVVTTNTQHPPIPTHQPPTSPTAKSQKPTANCQSLPPTRSVDGSGLISPPIAIVVKSIALYQVISQINNPHSPLSLSIHTACGPGVVPSSVPLVGTELTNLDLDWLSPQTRTLRALHARYCSGEPIILNHLLPFRTHFSHLPEGPSRGRHSSEREREQELVFRNLARPLSSRECCGNRPLLWFRAGSHRHTTGAPPSTSRHAVRVKKWPYMYYPRG